MCPILLAQNVCDFAHSSCLFSIQGREKEIVWKIPIACLVSGKMKKVSGQANLIWAIIQRMRPEIQADSPELRYIFVLTPPTACSFLLESGSNVLYGQPVAGWSFCLPNSSAGLPN